MTKTMNQRLRFLRETVGLSRQEAAKRAGIKYSTLAGHENPRDKEKGGELTVPMIQKYAEIYGARPEFIAFGAEPAFVSASTFPSVPVSPDAPAGHQSSSGGVFLTPAKVDYIPVLGVVEAGAFREMTEDFDGETVAYIPYSPDKQFQNMPHFAHIARGDSMNAGSPPILEGAIVISVDWVASGLEPRNGMYVIVERMTFGGHLREITVKEIEVVSDGINLLPRSTNPKHRPVFVPRGDFDDGTEVRIIGKVIKIQSDVP